jgi:hypothetical protein
MNTMEDSERVSMAKHSGIGLLVILSLLTSGCALQNISMALQVMLYSGDGVIHNCASSPPILGMLFSGPGYRIDFPKFPSDRAYQASYRMSNVPRGGGHRTIIYLRFMPDPNQGNARKQKESVTAEFRIVLKSAQGSVLHSAEIPVGSSPWTDAGGPDPMGSEFGVYQLEKSYLQFQFRTSYVLNVSYVPGDIPPPTHELYFSIESRASK